MSLVNFNNKTFSLVENSKNGTVTSKTIFKFKQDDNLVTADYSGGGIRYGKIVSKYENKMLHMLYQCLTEEGELKAGKAIAQISLNEKSKIRLELDWEWMGDTKQKGSSEYIEN